MRYVVILIAVWAALVYGPTAVRRALDPDTKLGLIEERITHIPGEFERRSQGFAQAWNDLKNCKETCNLDEIIQRRDRALAQDWPDIFDRLVVYKDWGEYYQSAAARDEFFRDLRKHGAHALRNRCVPKISFEKLPEWGNYNSSYYFRGYQCGRARHR